MRLKKIFLEYALFSQQSPYERYKLVTNVLLINVSSYQVSIKVTYYYDGAHRCLFFNQVVFDKFILSEENN